MRASLIVLMAAAFMASGVVSAELTAVVHKSGVDVHARPAFDAPTIASPARNTAVRISAQQGLWYELKMPDGTPGYVRVDDVRIDYGSTDDGAENLQVLMGGKPGQGRITETAGVRGIDESDLKSAAFDQTQLSAMIGYRVDVAAAALYAGQQSWTATSVVYAGEYQRSNSPGAATLQSASSQAASQLGNTSLGAVGRQVSSLFGGGAAKVIPKSEDELAAEELALGPEIAGRILGARPLWANPDAQQRVNRVGRWVASQTSRPELPWTFGVIDTPEVNAFAAPGGYILVTRGLYELLATDAELAAVVGHEISHCVQRDHYNVIQKQKLTTAGKDLVLQDVTAGGDAVAVNFAKRYVDDYGATIVLTSLDRDAEYRSDEVAEIYVARAGMNPLALYAVLQKMTALGNKSASLAQLYETHPSLDARLDRIDRRGYGALEPYTTRD
jgi:beta-barrel assembly-enhancing protease